MCVCIHINTICIKYGYKLSVIYLSLYIKCISKFGLGMLELYATLLLFFYLSCVSSWYISCIQDHWSAGAYQCGFSIVEILNYWSCEIDVALIPEFALFCSSGHLGHHWNPDSLRIVSGSLTCPPAGLCSEWPCVVIISFLLTLNFLGHM